MLAVTVHEHANKHIDELHNYQTITWEVSRWLEGENSMCKRVVVVFCEQPFRQAKVLCVKSRNHIDGIIVRIDGRRPEEIITAYSATRRYWKNRIAGDTCAKPLDATPAARFLGMMVPGGKR
jgi:hypothetical protein